MNQPTLSPYSCTAWRWILTKPHLRDACGQVQGNPPGSQAGIAVEGAVSDKEEEFHVDISMKNGKDSNQELVSPELLQSLC